MAELKLMRDHDERVRVIADAFQDNQCAYGDGDNAMTFDDIAAAVLDALRDHGYNVARLRPIGQVGPGRNLSLSVPHVTEWRDVYLNIPAPAAPPEGTDAARLNTGEPT